MINAKNIKPKFKHLIDRGDYYLLLQLLEPPRPMINDNSPGQRPNGVSDLRHHGDGKREENNGAQASNLV